MRRFAVPVFVLVALSVIGVAQSLSFVGTVRSLTYAHNQDNYATVLERLLSTPGFEGAAITNREGGVIVSKDLTVDASAAKTAYITVSSNWMDLPSVYSISGVSYNRLSQNYDQALLGNEKSKVLILTYESCAVFIKFSASADLSSVFGYLNTFIDYSGL